LSLQDLKRQIQSVNNTAKMTQALQTISAIKLNKARAHLDRARPYTDNVEEMMRDIADRAQSDTPLLVGRDEVNNVAICTVTSDRGLAGAFNAQVLRRTMELRGEQDAEIVQIVTGRKAREFFRFRRMGVEEAYIGFSDSPSYEKAREIGSRLTQLFEGEEADMVYLVYNRFKNALVQQPIATRILPIASEDTDDGARMTAMKSASDSANEMSEELTMQLNKMRQAAITQEIIEIASAAEAIGG
jgi:F-type H+-transporting ATPase subunit gamma